MLVLAAGFSVPALKAASGAIALAGTIAYVGAFAFGTGPIPGLFSSELLSDSVRGACWHDHCSSWCHGLRAGEFFVCLLLVCSTVGRAL